MGAALAIRVDIEPAELRRLACRERDRRVSAAGAAASRSGRAKHLC